MGPYAVSRNTGNFHCYLLGQTIGEQLFKKFKDPSGKIRLSAGTDFINKFLTQLRRRPFEECFENFTGKKFISPTRARVE